MKVQYAYASFINDRRDGLQADPVEVFTELSVFYKLAGCNVQFKLVLCGEVVVHTIYFMVLARPAGIL